MMRLRSIPLLVLAVALVATVPAWAQKQSLADRVASLEQQSAAQTQAAGQGNVEAINRLTQLQGEVQTLRNQVEQLQNEIEQAKQRNRDQYLDLDTRLQRLEGGSAGSAPAVKPAAAAAAAVPAPEATPADALGNNGAASVAATDEQTLYSAAFDALKRGDYVESARGFQAYLHAFPKGALAPNAWYWLGESYYVTQNYPVALQSFDNLLTQFPNSNKASDALLKKGYSQIEMKQLGAGRQTLGRVIGQYPDSDASRLAQSRLRALDLESR